MIGEEEGTGAVRRPAILRRVRDGDVLRHDVARHETRELDAVPVDLIVNGERGRGRGQQQPREDRDGERAGAEAHEKRTLVYRSP